MFKESFTSKIICAQKSKSWLEQDIKQIKKIILEFLTEFLKRFEWVAQELPEVQ